MISKRALAILLIKHVLNGDLESVQQDFLEVWTPAHVSFCRSTDASFF